MNKIIFALASLIVLSSCSSDLFRESSEPASNNNAVVALVNSAHTDAAANKFDAAGATLERALRIEPRNPALWQELARVRLQQGEYQQVESLAAKSNGLAGDNKSMRAENWRLIGQARLKRGDHQGAQAAFNKAAETN
ncbi:MAG: tetratricopeptide repeat protein [Gammaproteobacteria bacterium]|nr:tetratricopeptide repeat protein [Gammaproteobacteria bacterium]